MMRLIMDVPALPETALKMLPQAAETCYAPAGSIQLLDQLFNLPKLDVLLYVAIAFQRPGDIGGHRGQDRRRSHSPATS